MSHSTRSSRQGSMILHGNKRTQLKATNEPLARLTTPPPRYSTLSILLPQAPATPVYRECAFLNRASHKPS
jgi:hypothetical protein